MQDIAADRHDQPGNLALLLPDGQRIEQPLRRVLMLPVARVEHRAIDFVGDQLHRAAALVADHDRIGVHRVQRHRRIDQRFALFYRALRDVHIDHVGPQPLSRQLEREQRPGAVFKERIDDRQPRQPLIALVRRAPQRDPLFGLIEQEQQLPRGEASQPDQVTMRESGGTSWVAVRGACVWRCH